MSVIWTERPNQKKKKTATNINIINLIGPSFHEQDNTKHVDISRLKILKKKESFEVLIQEICINIINITS